jgi:hypothetical protein
MSGWRQSAAGPAAGLERGQTSASAAATATVLVRADLAGRRGRFVDLPLSHAPARRYRRVNWTRGAPSLAIEPAGRLPSSTGGRRGDFSLPCPLGRLRASARRSRGRRAPSDSEETSGAVLPGLGSGAVARGPGTGMCNAGTAPRRRKPVLCRSTPLFRTCLRAMRSVDRRGRGAGKARRWLTVYNIFALLRSLGSRPLH